MLRVAASAGVQQVLDAAGMSAADLADLQRDGFELPIGRRSPLWVGFIHAHICVRNLYRALNRESKL